MALTLERACFGYRGRPVLRDVTARLLPRRFTVIVGPNGSGKTTLLRLLLGFAAPGSGTCALDDAPTARVAPGERAARLAYVPHRPEVAFGFSVWEAAGLSPRAVGDADRRSALERFDVGDLAQRPVDRLSAGQRQRVALARAAAQLQSSAAARRGVARYLIADEPIAPLDPRAALRALCALKGLAEDQGIGVVAVMHDLAFARRFADDAIALAADGRLVGAGSASDVLTPRRLDDVFGVFFREHRVEGEPVLTPIGPRDVV